MAAQRFLLIAGFADSLLGFRGPLIAALQAQGLQVHVAAPGLAPGSAALHCTTATVHARLTHGTRSKSQASHVSPLTPRRTAKLPHSMISGCTGATATLVSRLTTESRPK